MIIGGDFNLTLNSDKDRLRSIESHTRAQETIMQHMKSMKLCDFWRTKYPSKHEYTWRRKRGNSHIAARLDFFLISQTICNRISDIQHRSGFQTDHSSVVLNVELGASSKRGPGFWKYNNLLLEDEYYVSQARRYIQEALKKYAINNPITRWEMVKCDLIAYSKNYSHMLAVKNVKILWLLKKE